MQVKHLVWLSAASIISPHAFAAEVVAVDFLNAALANKPAVVVISTASRPPTKEEIDACIRDLAPFFPNPDAAKFSKCVKEPRAQEFSTTAPATVKNAFVVSVSKMAFDETKLTSLPTSGLLTKKRIQNCADATLTDTVTLTVSGTRGWSVQKTNSISTTTGISVSGSFGTPGVAGGSVGFKWDQTISSSQQQSESKSDTVTRTVTDALNVPAKTALDAELFAFQAQAKIPFHAEITIDGEVNSNSSSISKASQLLSAAERTLPFDGELVMDEVSDSTFRTIPLTGANGCTPTDTGILESKPASVHIKPAEVTKLGESFQSPKALIAQAKLKKLASSTIAALENLDTGPTIGPPDGTSYSISYTVDVILPDAGNCGYNDFSIPNPAIYRREARVYSTYSNGTLISTEAKDVDIFVSCQPI